MSSSASSSSVTILVDCRDLATAKSKNKNSLIDKNCENHIGKNSLDWVLESFKSQIDLWLFAGWYVGVKRDYIKWSLNRYVWLSIWRHKPKLLCIAIWRMNKLPFIFYQNVFWWNSKFFYPRWVAIPCCSYAPTLLECWHITLAR